MTIISVIAFLLLALSFVSIWVKRDPKIWGGLLCLSVVAGLMSANVQWIGLLILFGWALLWLFYVKREKMASRLGLFVLIVFLSYGFKFYLFPGFHPVSITPKFLLGLDVPLVEIFPLALLVPIAMNKKDWKIVFTKGLGLACAGIAVLALLAIASGSVQWQWKLPSYAAMRYPVNLLFTAIPEEAFYRGFVQGELCRFLPKTTMGKVTALVVSSLIFTFAHFYWSPDLGILAFVFLASLLYGGVYMLTGKIEASILCHFLLNFVHMTFFSYHAM